LDRIKEDRQSSYLSNDYELKFRDDRIFIAKMWQYTKNTFGCKRKSEIQSPLDEISVQKLVKFNSNLED
jgi:hypothetical protein